MVGIPLGTLPSLYSLDPSSPPPHNYTPLRTSIPLRERRANIVSDATKPYGKNKDLHPLTKNTKILIITTISPFRVGEDYSKSARRQLRHYLPFTTRPSHSRHETPSPRKASEHAGQNFPQVHGTRTSGTPVTQYPPSGSISLPSFSSFVSTGATT